MEAGWLGMLGSALCSARLLADRRFNSRNWELVHYTMPWALVPDAQDHGLLHWQNFSRRPAGTFQWGHSPCEFPWLSVRKDDWRLRDLIPLCHVDAEGRLCLWEPGSEPWTSAKALRKYVLRLTSVNLSASPVFVKVS